MYYGKVIRDNIYDIEVMKKVVKVIWYYIKFIDENLDYDFCFFGVDLWCGF